MRTISDAGTPTVSRHAGIGGIARVPAEEVIRQPPADAVELDPLANDGAARQRLVLVQRQHLRGQHLQLQRHDEAVLRPAVVDQTSPQPSPQR